MFLWWRNWAFFIHLTRDVTWRWRCAMSRRWHCVWFRPRSFGEYRTRVGIWGRPIRRRRPCRRMRRRCGRRRLIRWRCACWTAAGIAAVGREAHRRALRSSDTIGRGIAARGSSSRVHSDVLHSSTDSDTAPTKAQKCSFSRLPTWQPPNFKLAAISTANLKFSFTRFHALVERQSCRIRKRTQTCKRCINSKLHIQTVFSTNHLNDTPWFLHLTSSWNASCKTYLSNLIRINSSQVDYLNLWLKLKF